MKNIIEYILIFAIILTSPFTPVFLFCTFILWGFFNLIFAKLAFLWLVLFLPFCVLNWLLLKLYISKFTTKKVVVRRVKKVVA